MKKAVALMVLAGVCGAAMAHPDLGNSRRGKATSDPLPPVMPEAFGFFDNFDSYTPGSLIVGQGNWELWYTGGLNAAVVNAAPAAFSAPNSLACVPAADIVQRFTITGGAWDGGAMTYMASTTLGDGYFIVMNGYGAAALDNWSVQVRFGGVDNLVESQFGFEVLPLQEDAWKQLRFTVDLDQLPIAELDIYYDGTLLADNLDWQNNVSGAGNRAIACYDLYSATGLINFDNVKLFPQCYCDCEEDGDNDVFDFLCYNNEYAGKTDYADCEMDGDWDVFDYLCFLNSCSGPCP